jgi:hypothetical protein
MNFTLYPRLRFAVVLLALALGSRAFGAVDPPAIHRPAAARQFSNPIISGFASDPSVVRVGDDFYLVNSTFEYYPGIPVYHSRDLVNWSLIGHAMRRTFPYSLERWDTGRDDPLSRRPLLYRRHEHRR